MTQADALDAYDKYLRECWGEPITGEYTINYAAHDKGLNVQISWVGLIDEYEIEPALITGFAKCGVEEFFDLGGTLRSSGLYVQTLIRKILP